MPIVRKLRSLLLADDERRPERPDVLAVDQQRDEGGGTQGGLRTRRSVGPLEVGQVNPTDRGLGADCYRLRRRDRAAQECPKAISPHRLRRRCDNRAR
jgi:hypothetical protein